MCEFCHLHVHSHFSLKDSVAKPENIALKAKELGMSAIALSDHGSLAGIIPFYKCCNEAGIKPILGVEAYYTDDLSQAKPDYQHLLLLAKNMNGYKKILRATTYAYTDGFKKRPMMDWNAVNSLEDVIVTTACVGGILTKDFLDNDFGLEAGERGIARSLKFASKFGRDFFVEVQMHHSQTEMFNKCNEFAMKFAKDNGFPLILTNDCHFVEKEDMRTHQAWVATRFNKTIATNDYVYDDSFYIKSPDEMLVICPNRAAFDNTMEIMDRIDWIDLNIGVAALPTFEGLTPQESNNKLVELAKEGLKRIQGSMSSEEFRKRVERTQEELKFIVEYDFGEYFLHIWRVVNNARANGVLTGPGRGSVGGSIVAYLIGITELDPIDHGLLFTRFLNPGRVQKKKRWTVELEDGSTTEIVEGMEYHVKDGSGGWLVKQGQELIQEYTEEVV